MTRPLCNRREGTAWACCPWICCRCLGSVTGCLLANGCRFDLPFDESTIIVACLILMLPVVLDGYQSYFGRGTVNWKRFATGVLAGGALSVLLGTVL